MSASRMAVLKTDLDLTTKDLSGLTSADALAAFLSRLGYNTSRRTVLTPSSLGLSGDTAASIRSIELLSEDEDKFLRVLFAQPKSLTAKVRNDLVRILGKSNEDYLVILAADFDTLEFVLLDKKTKEQGRSRRRLQGPGRPQDVQHRPPEAEPAGRADPPAVHLDAPGRPRPVRQASRRLRQRRLHRRVLPEPGLFSDYFLRERLKEDAGLARQSLRCVPAGPRPLQGRPESLARQGPSRDRRTASEAGLRASRVSCRCLSRPARALRARSRTCP